MNDTASVVPALIDIVRSEGPIHIEEAGRVLCRAFGTRLTEANYGLLSLAVDAAVDAQAVERLDGFLRRLPGAPVVVRYRAGDCPVTKPGAHPARGVRGGRAARAEARVRLAGGRSSLECGSAHGLRTNRGAPEGWNRASAQTPDRRGGNH